MSTIQETAMAAMETAVETFGDAMIAALTPLIKESERRERLVLFARAAVDARNDFRKYIQSGEDHQNEAGALRLRHAMELKIDALELALEDL